MMIMLWISWEILGFGTVGAEIIDYLTSFFFQQIYVVQAVKPRMIVRDENPDLWKVNSFKPRVGQTVTLHAALAARKSVSLPPSNRHPDSCLLLKVTRSFRVTRHAVVMGYCLVRPLPLESPPISPPHPHPPTGLRKGTAGNCDCHAGWNADRFLELASVAREKPDMASSWSLCTEQLVFDLGNAP